MVRVPGCVLTDFSKNALERREKSTIFASVPTTEGRGKAVLSVNNLQLNRCTHLAVLKRVSFFFYEKTLYGKPFRNRFAFFANWKQ